MESRSRYASVGGSAVSRWASAWLLVIFTSVAFGRTASLAPAMLGQADGGVKNSGEATPSCPCRLWGPEAMPDTTDSDDGQAVELGVKFHSGSDGFITGVRFYKSAANIGTHVAHLWTGSGVLLASAPFTAESGSGWQEARFNNPVYVKAEITYVASYYAPVGHYSADKRYFTRNMDTPPLHAVADAAGANGVYHYGPSAFPASSYESSNYWVDVVFDTNAALGTPIAVAALQPKGAAAEVRTNRSVENSSAALDHPAESAAGTSCPCRLWGPEAMPDTTDSDDGQAVELGVKFHSGSDGFITGVRFYKSAANIGTHVAHLWTGSGVLLASAPFTAESGSGWQEARFNNPVYVKAEITYVASYYAPVGHYSADKRYFTRNMDTPPLHAVADAAGANGVYHYGPSAFPASSYESSNYWVDVVFDTNAALGTPIAVAALQPKGAAAEVRTNRSVENSSAALDHPAESAAGTSCPCRLWGPEAMPDTTDSDDGQAVELGVKFHSGSDGFITGVRFYKSAANIGTHVAHLWTGSGVLLASAPFTAESGSGWQEARFNNPVYVKAEITYVASYYAPVGHYSADKRYFTRNMDTPPLHAVADAAGANGVYHYGPSAFPASSYESSNYWVDMVFETSAGPSTPPAITGISPADGAVGVPMGIPVHATFTQPMDPKTVNSASFVLRDASHSVVPSVVTYNTMATTATLRPAQELLPSSSYTVTLSAEAAGPKAEQSAANPLAASRTWSFTTGPAPSEGPGGPILIVTSAFNPFSRYYGEILRTEGLNEFDVRDIQALSPAILEGYDLIILGEFPLAAAQVKLFGDWVETGGSLIAMRPDKQLADLLGLNKTSGKLSNGYLLVNTLTGPGAGIVQQTIQFHGTADLYTLSGASSLATLYSDAVTATSSPAVTLRTVGSKGAQAAAFAYDLARSIVYTRQGNPAWSGKERDGVSPIRSDDLFFGAAGRHSEPDWIDLEKVDVPQADEQQRLLANLILQMNLAKKPLPRFWYFPRMLKAVVVMTGDDHAHGGTAGRFDRFLAASSAGCSVEKWECVRSTAYIYPSTPLGDSQAASYSALGFELALHLTTGTGDSCSNFTRASLDEAFRHQLSEWAATYMQLPTPSTERNHCIVWSDYDTQPQIELKHGIRFDTNYYYWPDTWVRDRPGFFTGSGFPMHFADRNGGVIDVYQAATQMTDESGQSYPRTVDALLDNAVGPLGYYGAFVANIHNDSPQSAASDAIVASAKARDVPVISSVQMLSWLDGRNASSFDSLTWNDNTLSFHMSIAEGANGLDVMIPSRTKAQKLTGLSCDGRPVTYTTQTIKGIEYAFFEATSAACRATYSQPIPLPPS